MMALMHCYTFSAQGWDDVLSGGYLLQVAKAPWGQTVTFLGFGQEDDRMHALPLFFVKAFLYID